MRSASSDALTDAIYRSALWYACPCGIYVPLLSENTARSYGARKDHKEHKNEHWKDDSKDDSERHSKEHTRRQENDDRSMTYRVGAVHAGGWDKGLVSYGITPAF